MQLRYEYFFQLWTITFLTIYGISLKFEHLSLKEITVPHSFIQASKFDMVVYDAAVRKFVSKLNKDSPVWELRVVPTYFQTMIAQSLSTQNCRFFSWCTYWWGCGWILWQMATQHTRRQHSSLDAEQHSEGRRFALLVDLGQHSLTHRGEQLYTSPN